MPASPAQPTTPRPAPVADIPTPSGFYRLAGLVSQTLAATWMPLCPALSDELARGAGRRN